MFKKIKKPLNSISKKSSEGYYAKVEFISEYRHFDRGIATFWVADAFLKTSVLAN